MRIFSRLPIKFTALAVLAACGNSDDSDPGGSDAGTSTDGASKTSDAGAGKGGTDCSCTVTNNGEAATIVCGAAACVDDTSFECDSDANLTMAGTACVTPAPAADASTDAAPADAAPTKDSGGTPQGSVAWGGSCSNDSDCAPGPAGAAAEPGACGLDSTGASRCDFTTNNSNDCPSGSVFREIPGGDGYGVCGFPSM